MKAYLRSGRGINREHIVVVWLKIDLGNGPEWIAVGKVKQ